MNNILCAREKTDNIEMGATGILFAVLPVFFFYLIYRDYFVFRHDWILQIDSFLRGVLAASVLLIVLATLAGILKATHLPLFLQAAVPEKLVLFISLAFLAPRMRSLSDASAAGAVAGLGFALSENLAYGFLNPAAVVSARMLTAVPLHMSTTGLMSFYIWQMRQRSGPASFLAFFCALPLTIAVHAVFDFLITTGRPLSASLICIFPLLIALDLHLAYARSIPSPTILGSMGLRLTEWIVLKRQAQCERWILRSIASDRAEYPPVFRFQINGKRIVLAAIFVAIPIVQTTLFPTSFGQAEQNSFLTLSGLLLSALVLSGLFNPAYFRSGMLRIPIVMQVWFEGGGEPAACYDVTTSGAFVKTAMPLNIGDRLQLSFSRGRLVSPTIQAQVIWDNHRNLRQEFGTVFQFLSSPPELRAFLRRLWFLEIRQGLGYVLRLPGYDLIRRLFIQPESMMQDIRFFPAGSVLIHEGEAGDEFFMVRQGRVRVTKRIGSDEQELAELGPGEILGEMAIAGSIPRSASATCVSDVILTVADGKDLDALVRNNPDFARALLHLTVRRSFDSKATLEAGIEGTRVDVALMETLTHAWIRLLLGGSLSKGELGVTLSEEHLSGVGLNAGEALQVLRTNPANVHRADGSTLELIWRLSKFKLRVKIPSGKWRT